MRISLGGSNDASIVPLATGAAGDRRKIKTTTYNKKVEV